MVVQEAKSGVDKPLKLTIYNSRKDELRSVDVTPTLSWGGDGILGTGNNIQIIYAQALVSDSPTLMTLLISLGMSW